MILPNKNSSFIFIATIIVIAAYIIVAVFFFFVKAGVLAQEFLSINVVEALFNFFSAIFWPLIPLLWKAARKVKKSQPPLSTDPKEWIKTNHSYPEISLISVKDKSEEDNSEKEKAEEEKDCPKINRSDINRIVGKVFKKKIFWLKQVDEDSSSTNYRIKPLIGDSFLLRIQKRINYEPALRDLIKIHKLIYDSDVFESSPYHRCLLPIQINEDGYEIYEKRLVLGFPFADEVRHYSGESIRELGSVAEKLGGIQRVLSKLPINNVFDLIEKQESITKPFPKSTDLGKLLERAKDYRSKDDCINAFIHLEKDLKTTLRHVQKNIVGHAAEVPCLHDCHPHNTFVKNKECVLIYDYEAVSCKWSEVASLAFSLHRFCRESIRVQLQLDERMRNSDKLTYLIKKNIEIFLKGYEKGRGSLPENILENLQTLIIYTNVPKLVEIMKYYLTPIKDPSKRKRETHQAEIIKFLAYIKEAKLFDQKK